jgi:hypothetical protein
MSLFARRQGRQPAICKLQLTRLLALAERPSVTVRVLEFSRGAHPAAGAKG